MEISESVKKKKRSKFFSFIYFPKCILNHIKIKEIRIIKKWKILALSGTARSSRHSASKKKDK